MKRLMVGSAVVIVVGIGVIASDMLVSQSYATVPGRLMSPKELQQIVGATIAGPCRNLGKCGLVACAVAGANCTKCSGTGFTQSCRGQDANDPCTPTTEPTGCGEREKGICTPNGADWDCTGLMALGKDCQRVNCGLVD